MQIYDVSRAEHRATMACKRTGCNLGQWLPGTPSILYATTQDKPDVRLLDVSQSAIVRNFTGHRTNVTDMSVAPIIAKNTSSTAMHVDEDLHSCFLSAAPDCSVRFWDVRQGQAARGVLAVKGKAWVDFDPSALVFAILVQATRSLLLYDSRKFDKVPHLHIFSHLTLTLKLFSFVLQGPFCKLRTGRGEQRPNQC